MLRWCIRMRGGAGWLLLALAATALLLLPSQRTPNAHPLRVLLQTDTSSTVAPTAPSPAPAPSDDLLRDDAARRLPSLPLHFWQKHKDDKNKFLDRKDCAPFPSLYELEFHNVYWQTLRTTNGTFHLYGAYLDVRNASRIGPAVRMLAVHDRLKPTLATHCQLWFEGRDPPVVVRVLEYKYVWNAKWGNHRDGVLQPYLLACVLPAAVRHLRPAAVSLVQGACDRATTLLAVAAPEHPAEPPPRIAVCVKGLDFLHEDLSLRLVEWIELVLLLGADKIFFYELQVHPNVRRVLDHYARRGLVDVTRVTLPGGQPNLPALQHMYLKKKTTHKRQMELVPYNDCLYRNLYSYRWVALLDVDEVIVPLREDDWPGLLRGVMAESAPPAGKAPRSSYHAANLYYLDSLQHAHGWERSVPRHLHMLQHVWRARNFTKPGQYVKAFHETGRVLALHNHFPLACLGGPCSSYALPTERARLQHYRADCVTALSKTCAALRENPVRDAELWRWKKPLVERVSAALSQLGLEPRPVNAR